MGRKIEISLVRDGVDTEWTTTPGHKHGSGGADVEPPVLSGHADPHYMRHPVTDDDWCICPCDGCYGHVGGCEAMDCMCVPCSCHRELVTP